MSPASPSSKTVPLRDVMERLGDEMQSAANACETLQDTVSRLLVAKTAESTGPVTELQKLDALTQTLWNLNAFVAKLAVEADEAASIDVSYALALLSLRDLALSLDRPEPAAAPQTSDETEGDVDLFAEG